MDPIRPELPEQVSEFSEDVRKIKRKYDSLEKDLGRYEKEEIENLIKQLSQNSSHRLKLLLEDVLKICPSKGVEDLSKTEFYELMAQVISKRISELEKKESENAKNLEESFSIFFKLSAIALSFLSLGLILFKPVSMILTPKTRIIQSSGVDDKYNTYAFPQYEIAKGGGVLPWILYAVPERLYLRENDLENKFRVRLIYENPVLEPLNNYSSEDLERLNKSLDKILKKKNEYLISEGKPTQSLKEPIGNGGRVPMAIPTPDNLYDVNTKKMFAAEREGESRATFFLSIAGLASFVAVTKKRKIIKFK